MIHPTPESIVPSQLNYVKVFTRFIEFEVDQTSLKRNWIIVSADPPTEDEVNAWVDETKSLVIMAETRTDIAVGDKTKIVTQTTTVIYTKAVEYHGRDIRNVSTEPGSTTEPTDRSPSGDTDVELVAGQVQPGKPVSPEG